MSPHPVPSQIPRFERASLIAGLAGLGVCLVAAFSNPTQFFRSYLFAYLFWVGLAIGCLCILMLHHLSGGMWGLVIRRILEAGTRTFPVAALLFLPLACGSKEVYVWADPGRYASDRALHEAIVHKAPYLNVPFFLARTGFYFAVWVLLSHFLNLWSRELDKGEDLRVSRRLRSLSGGGLVLMGLTITFSSIDWAMSTDPKWASTIWGLMFMVGDVLTAFAFSIVVLAYLRNEAPFSEVLNPVSIHDLGKFLFAFVMLWGYMNLSQFLIIWSGNLPEEISYYTRRLRGGWEVVGLVIVGFHFVIPFLLLLSRGLKRNPALLGPVAAGMVLVRLLDVFWIMAPQFRSQGFELHLTDVLAPIGVGGIWLFAFARELRGRPLVPVGEPEIREILERTEATAS